MKSPELSVIVPFYDEEGTVESLTKVLIKEFKKADIDYELVLVNNGSSDSTPKIVDKLSKRYKRVKAVHVKINQGYGFGILNGLKVANGSYVGYMDGDFEIQPKDTIRLYKKIKISNADIGKGIRSKREVGVFKNIASFGYDILFFLLYFRFIKQVNANPKIMKKSCYKKMNLRSKDWFIDTEILIKALKNNYKIISQVISYRPRISGKSHLRFFDLFPEIIKYFKSIMKYRFFRD